MRNNKKGFTIVELVIVIAVIAILAAVLIPTFSSITQSAKESAAMQQAKSGLNAVLALTGGSMPSGTIFAVTDDSDTTADYLYEYKNNKLQLMASGEDVAEYTHKQKLDNHFCVYVSAKAINGTILDKEVAELIAGVLGAGAISDSPTLKSTGQYYTGTIGTVENVRVYYTSDIEDTMVILLGDGGATEDTPTPDPETPTP